MSGVELERSCPEPPVFFKFSQAERKQKWFCFSFCNFCFCPGTGESAMRRGFREWGHGLHLSQAGVGRAQRWGGTREGLQQWRPLCRSVHTHTRACVHKTSRLPFSVLTGQLRPVTPSVLPIYRLHYHSEASAREFTSLFVNHYCQTRLLLEPLTLTVHVRERGSHWHYRGWLPYMYSLGFSFHFVSGGNENQSFGRPTATSLLPFHTVYFPDSRAEWFIFKLSASIDLPHDQQLMPLYSLFDKIFIPSVARQYLLRFLEWNNCCILSRSLLKTSRSLCIEGH